MARDCWRVVALLDSEMAGLPPMLDGIATWMMLRLLSASRRAEVERSQARLDTLAIGLRRSSMADVCHIPRASAPCCGSRPADAAWIDEAAAGPLRYEPARVSVVTWFVVGDGRRLERMVRHVDTLGPQRNGRSGVVGEWRVEPWLWNWSWFADLGGDGPPETRYRIMRPLPENPAKPLTCLGGRPAVMPCKPPYWRTEAIPCRVPVWMAGPEAGEGHG